MSSSKFVKVILLIGMLFSILITSQVFARISVKGSKVSKSFELTTKYGQVNIEIHGFETDRDFIAKAEKIIKKDLPKLFEYFKYVPQNTIFYEVESDIHQSNGMATFYPHNKVVLYNYPPNADGLLLASDDWIRTLIIHETTHIIHMDYTTGWVDNIRNVFGSIFKLNWIAPLWFLEGVAVWSETNFSEGGRNRYTMNQLAVDSYLLEHETCNHVGCIEDAPVYPYRGLSYLLGGKFVEYLENYKPGTVACIVRENSNNIPGFLDNAFMDCLGIGIRGMYERFYNSYMANLRDDKEAFINSELGKASDHKQIANRGNGRISLDQGAELIEGKLVFGTYNDHAPYINAWNLDNDEVSSLQIENKLKFIVPPTDYSREHNRYPVLVYEYDGVEDINTRWFILDGKKLEKISSIAEDGSSQYLFQIDEEKYISLRFKNNVWWVYDNDGPTYNLEKFRTIAHPFITKVRGKNYLIYQTFYKDKFSLQAFDLENKSRKDLYVSDATFNIAGFYKEHLFLNSPNVEKNEMTVISLESSSFISKLKGVGQIARIKFDEKETVYFHQMDSTSVHRFRGNGESFIAFLRSESVQLDDTKFKSIDESVDQIENQNGYSSSPKLRNFVPGYWMISWGDDYLTAYTTFVDPLEDHRLEAQGYYYSRVKNLGGDLLYDYQIFKNHYIGGEIVQKYIYSEYREKSYRENTFEAHIRSEFKLARNIFPFILSAEREYDANTFMDEIEVEDKASATIGWTYLPKYWDDTFNLLSSSVTLSRYQDESIDNDYYGLFGLLKSKIYFSHRTELVFEGFWGRLYKDNLDGKTYSFYKNFGSIVAGDIFGNKLNYADAKLDITGHTPYRGWGNLPLFIKEIHYLIGFERVNADYIYASEYLEDETLYNMYYGARFDLRLLYIADLSLEWLIHKRLNDGEKSASLNFVGTF